MIGFSTFLLGCIDYASLRRHNHTRLSEIIVDRCVSRCVSFLLLEAISNLKISVRFSGFTLLFFLLFTAFYIWQIIAYAMGIMRLVDMYNFYTHLLKIPDVSSHSLDIMCLTYMSPGRHTNHFMVGSCSTNWRNSRGESPDRYFIKQGKESEQHNHSQT